MATVIKLVQSDDLPGITFVIRDSQKAAVGQELDRRDSSTWAIVNLTGCTVSAAVAKVGSSILLEHVDCFISSPLAGEVLLVIKDSAFVGTVGQYQIEVTITSSEGQQTVYDMIELDVRERIKNVP